MKYIVNPEAALPSSFLDNGQLVFIQQGEEYPVERSGKRPDEIQLLLDMGQLVIAPDVAPEKRGKKEEA